VTDEVVRLERYDGPWEPDDPDANFKAEVAGYGRLDPLRTLTGLSAHTGIPVGALARYVLARFATTGSGGLLELGPAMVQRLREPVRRAEAEGTDEARLAAYREIAALLGWLGAPLDDPELYPGP
jgi:hypothetical protein